MSEEVIKAKQELDRIRLRLGAVSGAEKGARARLAAADQNIEILKGQLEQATAERATLAAAATACDAPCRWAIAAEEAQSKLLVAAERKAAIETLEREIEEANRTGASKVRLDQLGDLRREARSQLVPDVDREKAAAALREAEEGFAKMEEAERRTRRIAELERDRAAADRRLAALTESVTTAQASVEVARAEVDRISGEIEVLKGPADPAGPPSSPAGATPAPLVGTTPAAAAPPPKARPASPTSPDAPGIGTTRGPTE